LRAFGFAFLAAFFADFFATTFFFFFAGAAFFAFLVFLVFDFAFFAFFAMIASRSLQLSSRYGPTTLLEHRGRDRLLPQLRKTLSHRRLALRRLGRELSTPECLAP
jgi:hypothetical protein